jgi:hypothetical protein
MHEPFRAYAAIFADLTLYMPLLAYLLSLAFSCFGLAQVPEYLGANSGVACDLVHIDGGHFDFTPWNDLVELARSNAHY